MKIPSSLPRHAPRAVAALALLLWMGCASSPPPAPKVQGIFFPPAPELPRVQFLTAFSGRKDVEAQSQFNKFVVGEEPDIKLDKPYGAAVHAGRIYVCDVNHTVVVFDLAKKAFYGLAGATGRGQLVGPVNITITRDGTKYVADPARGQVVVFDKDDQYVRAYGEPSSWRPVDTLIDGDRLYVADSESGSVEKEHAAWKRGIRVGSAKDGTVTAFIPDPVESANNTSAAEGVAADAAGNIYGAEVGPRALKRYVKK